jgi:hypothetical protein
MTGDRPRSMGVVARLMTCMLMALVCWSTGTTTATAATFTYDAPAAARVDVHDIEAAEASPAQPSVVRGEPAEPPTASRAMSTSLVTSVVATNTLPDPELDSEGEAHVRARHFAGGAEVDSTSSIFDPGVNLDELVDRSRVWAECQRLLRARWRGWSTDWPDDVGPNHVPLPASCRTVSAVS